MRVLASERESGLEKADRSMSSGQGRRCERPDRTVSEMWVMNSRKAGVETGASEVVLAWGFVTGRTAGDDMATERENARDLSEGVVIWSEGERERVG